MPENLRTSLPTQEMENPKKDEKDDATDGDFTDSAKDEHSLTNSKVMPTQETKPLVLQNMGNILDPQRYFVIKQIGSGSCGKVQKIWMLIPFNFFSFKMPSPIWLC